MSINPTDKEQVLRLLEEVREIGFKECTTEERSKIDQLLQDFRNELTVYDKLLESVQQGEGIS